MAAEGALPEPADPAGDLRPELVATQDGGLPELAAVAWRPRVDERRLRREGALWTASTLAHAVPFLVVALALEALQPLLFPVAALAVAQAWVIPELYANRGAKVLRRRSRAQAGPERIALGLLGDLVDHAQRERLSASGIVLERGRLGVWLVGEAGAVLVRPGARRVHCFCVHVAQPDLPSADRIAHLLLALRADEAGFATVANSAFSGAAWRLRRRLPVRTRRTLDAAVAAARSMG